MMMFNWLTMWMLSSYWMSFNPETESGWSESNVDYETELPKVQKNVDALKDTQTDNDDGAKTELSGSLTDEFCKWINWYLDDKKDKKQELTTSLKEALKKHPNEKSLQKLEKALNLDTNQQSTSTEVNQNFPIKLDWLKADKIKDKRDWEIDNISKYIKTEKPDDEEWLEENVKLYQTKAKAEELSKKIVELLKNENLKVNDNLNKTKELVENINKILNNLTKDNIKLLQKFIFNNLDEDKKEQFKKDNYYDKKSDSFDGRLGKSTLWSLNNLWKKVEEYIGSFEKSNQANPESQEAENPLKDVEVNSEISLEWKTNVVATDLLKNLPDGAKAEFKDNEWIDKTKSDEQEVTVVVKDVYGKELGKITIVATVDTINNKVGLRRKETWNPVTATAAAIPEATKPTAPENITVNGEVHSIATEPPADQFKWWTLYCLNAWATENQEPQNNTLDINGDREYLMKMGENVYKVKIDQSWNLCPTAINMISNVPVVMKNSTSGKAYIENKLPPVLKGKCIIWLDWDDYTIALPWWWKKLTIEPMTIDWKWIWSLTDSLAFLNLTNYLRNSWKMNDIEFKNDNPDLKLEWNELYVRVKKTRDENWKKVKWLKVNKYDFWLTDKEEFLTKFIKYNNGEKWEDDWDRKKPNRYYSKIDLRWEAQLQVAWWSSQAPNSPFAGVNVHSQHRSAAETSIQWSSNVTLTSQSPKNQVGEEMDNENNQIEDAIVISTIFKPKNPIFWWDEKNQWDVIDDNNAQFDWIWVFNNGNFEFEKHIANQNGVISIWNDSFEKLEYIKDEGWQRLSKENFSWKWYMIGKYKFMNWKEEWRDVWYISVWNYKDWLMDWEWKRFFETGSKYEWNWKEGRENWQWKYTYANWDIYEWGFKDGKFEWEWKFIFKSWITITWKFENNNFVSWKLKHGDVAYDIEKDDKWLKITSEWSNNWQYITFNDWHLNIENSKVMIA